MRRLTALVALALLGVLPIVAAPASATPAPEAALAGVTQVSAGGLVTCARLSTGQARCWGTNDSGQLGDESTDPSSTPVTVVNEATTGPLTGVIQIATSGTHTCAVVGSDRHVMCWGLATSGELGNGKIGTFSDSPLRVRAVTGPGLLTGVAEVRVGFRFSCARLLTRQVRCWGDGSQYRLGNGATTPRTRPVVVRSTAGAGALVDVTQLSLGEATACARLRNGQARCWGNNANGQLGIGSTAPRTRPSVVRPPSGPGPLTGVLQVAVGTSHACAVVTGRQVRCWGANDSGQVGSTAVPPVTRPAVVRNPANTGALVGATQLTAGARHACVRLAAAQARCWGEAGTGQLGHGHDDEDQPLPVVVRAPSVSPPLRNVRAVVGGSLHSCALLTNAQLRCWGGNNQGQLGNGNNDPQLFPTAVVLG
jgi:alpha-tubulin suppressor-like RCC1 family protein